MQLDAEYLIQWNNISMFILLIDHENFLEIFVKIKFNF